MYRISLLVLCLILAGCNSEDSAQPGVAAAQVNAAAPAVLLVQAPPVLQSPSEDSLINDFVMPPLDEFPVLIFAYLAPYFDVYHGEQYADDMQRFHRAQVYSPFADRSLDWFGEQKSHEYETVVGIRTDWSEVSAYDADILRDASGNRLYFDFACTGSQCSQYADNPCSATVNELRLQRMEKSLITKNYRGLWLDNLDLAKPDGTLSISNGAGDFVRPVDPDTNQPMTNAKWNMCMADWVELVRDSFPSAELTHNSLWFAVRDDSVRRQHLAADYIHLERGFIDYGLTAGDGTYGFDTFLDYLDWVHSLGRKLIFGQDEGFMSAQEFDYALAAYFLVREDGDMFGINDTTRILPGAWDSRLDLDLGVPLGPRTDNGGSYTRDFECGSVTVWGPPERRGQITQTDCG